MNTRQVNATIKEVDKAWSRAYKAQVKAKASEDPYNDTYWATNDLLNALEQASEALLQLQETNNDQEHNNH